MQYLTNWSKIRLNQITGSSGSYMAKTPPNRKPSKKHKPTLCYLFAAGNSLRDTTTLKFSFIDLFDIIEIPKNLDFYYATFFIGGRINNVETGTNKTEIRMIHEDGTLFTSEVVGGKIEKGDVEFSILFNLKKFEKLGRYYFKVLHNKIELEDDNKYYIDVNPGK